jgi:prophage tail gpP-like protein
MPNVQLTVNGRSYAGWTSARVTRSVEAIAGSFSVSVSERWDGAAEPWPIVDGDECTLALDGTVLITGYVDTRSHSFAAQSHALSIVGRDKTGDLVDCSAVLSKWEFLQVSVPEFCSQIAAPFGVTVRVQSGLTITEKIAKLTVNPGETAFEVIDRACRMAAVLPIADGRGGLLLTRADLARRTTTALVEGENILSADASADSTRRYRRYIVSGQSAGSDDIYGASAAAIKETAEDLGVPRAARVLLLRPEGAVTRAIAKQRAEWEATVRAARSVPVTVTVQGWQQADGALWPVNALARLKTPRLGIDADLLISEVTYSLSLEAGTTTELKLVRPDAFTPEPVIGKKAKKGSSGSLLESLGVW